MVIESTNAEVASQVHHHHGHLASSLWASARRLSSALPAEAEARRSEVVAVVENEIIPHARHAEATLFVEAERSAELSSLVPPLREEHRYIGTLLETLKSSSPSASGEHALSLAEFFDGHVSRVNRLVDALAALPGCDLGRVLRGGAPEASQDDAAIDVRGLPHPNRHATIFAVLGRLASGQAVVITNDHDPLPLRYQIEAEHPETFDWSYLQGGPEIWQVAIRRR